MGHLLHDLYCNIGVVEEREEYKMKKWLATSLCAATLFGASFTSADAASLNKEVKSESNPQIYPND